MKNAAATLSTALNSILSQTYPHFEFIIIDDHSNDDSNKLLSKYSDDRIKLIDNQRAGIAAALNTGLAYSSGKYIGRMDADDVAYPNRLFEQLSYLQAHPKIDVVSCLVDHESIGEASQEGYKNHVDWINSIIDPADHYNNRFVDAIIAHPTLFCTKSVFDKHGMYSEDNLPEDFELWLRWMHNGVRFGKVPKVLYSWLDYPSRTSRIDLKYSNTLMNTVKSSYFKLWFDHNSDQKEVWVWGYGKDVFRKVAFLIKSGIEVAGFVDIKLRKSTERKVVSYTTVKKSSDKFYLIYVSDRKGKVLIKEYLNKNGLLPSVHYYFMT